MRRRTILEYASTCFRAIGPLLFAAVVCAGVFAEEAEELAPSGQFVRDPAFESWANERPRFWAPATGTVVEPLGDGKGIRLTQGPDGGSAKLSQYWSKTPKPLMHGDSVFLRVRVRCPGGGAFRALIRVYEEGTSNVVSAADAVYSGKGEWRDLTVMGYLGSTRFDMSITLVAEEGAAEVVYCRGFIIPEVP